MAHIAEHYTEMPPALAQAAYLHLLVVAQTIMLCVHPARDQQPVRRMVGGMLLLIVYAVGQGPRCIRSFSSGAGSHG